MEPVGQGASYLSEVLSSHYRGPWRNELFLKQPINIINGINGIHNNNVYFDCVNTLEETIQF